MTALSPEPLGGNVGYLLASRVGANLLAFLQPTVNRTIDPLSPDLPIRYYRNEALKLPKLVPKITVSKVTAALRPHRIPELAKKVSQGLSFSDTSVSDRDPERPALPRT